MRIDEIFRDFFRQYVRDTGREYLAYIITSGDRQGNVKSNPHALPGNAMDFTLRTNGEFSPIREYNELLKYMLTHWPYRAGLDNTPQMTIPNFPGNVHVHIDFGRNRPEGQAMPFFFIEDNGKYQKQVKKPEDIA